MNPLLLLSERQIFRKLLVSLRCCHMLKIYNSLLHWKRATRYNWTKFWFEQPVKYAEINYLKLNTYRSFLLLLHCTQRHRYSLFNPYQCMVMLYKYVWFIYFNFFNYKVLYIFMFLVSWFRIVQIQNSCCRFVFIKPK